MKKNLYFTLFITFYIILNFATPLVAQKSDSFSRNFIPKIPKITLPAWTESPSFEVAKKWWNAGRNENALTKKEKKVFNQLKQQIKISGIIAAVTAYFFALSSYVYSIRQRGRTLDIEQETRHLAFLEQAYYEMKARKDQAIKDNQTSLDHRIEAKAVLKDARAKLEQAQE